MNVPYLRNQFEPIIAECIISTIEEFICYATERSTLLEHLRITFHVCTEAKEWWSRDHDVHNKHPCGVAPLMRQGHPILWMRADMLGWFWDFKHIYSDQLEQAWCGNCLDFI
jgi:hypothetical protein